MSKNQSSQKFIGRNRAPRVQIEYDVELYGSEKKVNLPLVTGVISELSGKSEVPLEKINNRKFLEFDCDNFEERMKAIKPKASFRVPNTLTNEGELSINIDFDSMGDFAPDKVANKVEPLRKLLDARRELSNLISYMDGKEDAEELIGKIIQDKDFLKSLAATPAANEGKNKTVKEGE
jgi:type VI secretion system protein ImpB